MRVRRSKRPSQKRRSGPAVILVGHGSKTKGFDQAMIRVAGELRRGSFQDVRCAYLGVQAPSISTAIRQAIQRGAKDIRVFPYFVLAGKHVKKDIPGIVFIEKQRWKRRATIRLCDYLGYHEKIVGVVKERVQHA